MEAAKKLGGGSGPLRTLAFNDDVLVLRGACGTEGARTTFASTVDDPLPVKAIPEVLRAKYPDKDLQRQALGAGIAALGDAPGQGAWLHDHEHEASQWFPHLLGEDERATDEWMCHIQPRPRAPLVEHLLVKHLDELHGKLTLTMCEHYEGMLRHISMRGGQPLEVRLPNSIPKSVVRHDTGSTVGSSEDDDIDDDDDDDELAHHHVRGWQVGREMMRESSSATPEPQGGDDFVLTFSAVSKTTKDDSLVEYNCGGIRIQCASRSLPSSCRCFACLHSVAVSIVKAPVFDYVLGALVIANSVMIGFNTQWQSKSLENESPMVFQVGELLFFSLFAGEFILRILAFGRGMLFGSSWGWNLFDLLSLVSQVTEMWLVSTTNMSFIRIIRILRLVRVLRLMRILRVIGELRTLVTSIFASFKSLFWAIWLLLAFIYVVAIFLTQVVVRYRIDQQQQGGEEPSAALVTDWGTLGDSMWSLFRIVTPGADWYDLCTPLREEVGAWTMYVIATYIMFSVLCLLNVITSVFVESALLSATADKDVYMVNHLKTVFRSLDVGKSGSIGWPEFSKTLHTREMQEVFKAVDIDPSESKALFRLLDISGSGTIKISDFIAGCNRLRGPAKSLELNILHRETVKLSDRVHSHMTQMDRRLARMASKIQRYSALFGSNGGTFDEKVLTQGGSQWGSHEA